MVTGPPSPNPQRVRPHRRTPRTRPARRGHRRPEQAVRHGPVNEELHQQIRTHGRVAGTSAHYHSDRAPSGPITLDCCTRLPRTATAAVPVRPLILPGNGVPIRTIMHAD